MHRLGAIAAPWLVNPRQAGASSGAIAANASILRRLKDANLSVEHHDLVVESLALKQRVVHRIVSGGMPSPIVKIHLVHGDFHNENILYDADQDPTCIMDYEESYLGNGVIDVINFVQFACCNDGYGAIQVKRGQHFIRRYGECEALSAVDVRCGWQQFFWRIASSSFLESRLVDGDNIFAGFIRRDVAKLQNYLQRGEEIVQALLP